MAAVHRRADLCFFFWLPKSAGGTLAAGIRNAPRTVCPGPQFLALIKPDGLPAPSRNQVWFGGHTALGLHLVYNAQPVYFTVLRDPIDRLISEFFYFHQHRLPGVFIPQNERLPAFVRFVEAASHLNYYSYMFSDWCFEKETVETGLQSWNGNAITAFDLLNRRGERNGYLAENIPFDKVNVDEAFRCASKKIPLMRFIGFYHRLCDATAYLNGEFGLNVGLDVRLHQTPGKPRLKDIPASIVAMLKRKTEADYEFYYAAQQAPNAALSKPYRYWRKLASMTYCPQGPLGLPSPITSLPS